MYSHMCLAGGLVVGCWVAEWVAGDQLAANWTMDVNVSSFSKDHVALSSESSKSFW